jgi:Domain of unknown function (DUF4260)
MTAATMPTSAIATTSSAPVTGMTVGAVRGWLRLEGLAAFGAGLVLYAVNGGDWLWAIPALLLPDLSAAGYLLSQRIGTFTYNLVHNWAPGFVVLGLGLWLGSPGLQIVAAILIAHVGVDRAMGYGLKLPSSFQDTHLGRMGRRRR